MSDDEARKSSISAQQLFAAAVERLDRNSFGDSTLADWFEDDYEAYAEYLGLKASVEANIQPK